MGAQLRTLDWLLLLAIVAAAQGSTKFIDRVAGHAYGVRLDHASPAGLGPGGPLVVGRALASRYRIVRLLGRGGGGRAFLARDEVLDREVVVKEILLATAEEEARALDEGRAMARMRHPHVLQVHDVLRTRGAAYLVTDHAPGGSLADRLDSGPLPPHEGARLLDGILDGLAAVHEDGMVHGDLKPGNVLLDAAGVPLLADFGLARAHAEATRGATTRARPGTPSFMAPEQLGGRPPTVASDLYAVGRIGQACIATPLPPALDAILSRATRDDPDERWSSARDMRTALRATPYGSR